MPGSLSIIISLLVGLANFSLFSILKQKLCTSLQTTYPKNVMDTKFLRHYKMRWCKKKLKRGINGADIIGGIFRVLKTYMAVLFLKNSEQISTVDYLNKKAPSQMFDRGLNTHLMFPGILLLPEIKFQNLYFICIMKAVKAEFLLCYTNLINFSLLNPYYDHLKVRN